MDGNAARILREIVAASPNGEAVVMDLEDLIGVLGRCADPEREVKQILGALDAAALIKLKYSDGRSYCVSSEAKGRMAAAERKEVKSLNRKVAAASLGGGWKRLLLTALFAFLGAFAGAALAVWLCFTYLIGGGA